jgi:hypothetical protein
MDIDALPTELLAYIFEIAHRDDWSPRNPYLSPSHTTPGTPPEILLSHISTKWREIALSTPSLWSFIDTSLHIPILQTTTYLSRCQCSTTSPHPLRISFDYADDSVESHINGMIAWGKIAPHLNHTGSLRIRTNERLSRGILHMLEDKGEDLDVESLRHLSITVVDGNHLERSDDLVVRLFPRAKRGGGVNFNLELLHLSGCRPLVEFYPPLYTITTLHLHQCYGGAEYPTLTYRQFMAILQSAEMLEVLSIHGELITDWPSSISSTASLSSGSQDGPSAAERCWQSQWTLQAPSLQSIIIKFIPIPSKLFEIFCWLEAPKLSSVSLISIGDYDIMHVQSHQTPNVDDFPPVPLSIGNGSSNYIFPTPSLPDRIHAGVRSLTLETRIETQYPTLARIFPHVCEINFISMLGGMGGEIHSSNSSNGTNLRKLGPFFNGPGYWAYLRVLRIQPAAPSLNNTSSCPLSKFTLSGSGSWSRSRSFSSSYASTTNVFAPLGFGKIPITEFLVFIGGRMKRLPPAARSAAQSEWNLKIVAGEEVVRLLEGVIRTFKVLGMECVVFEAVKDGWEVPLDASVAVAEGREDDEDTILQSSQRREYPVENVTRSSSGKRWWDVMKRRSWWLARIDDPLWERRGATAP